MNCLHPKTKKNKLKVLKSFILLIPINITRHIGLVPCLGNHNFFLFVLNARFWISDDCAIVDCFFFGIDFIRLWLPKRFFDLLQWRFYLRNALFVSVCRNNLITFISYSYETISCNTFGSLPQEIQLFINVLLCIPEFHVLAHSWIWSHPINKRFRLNKDHKCWRT